MSMTMPFISQVGRSFWGMFSKESDEVKKKTLEKLSITVYDLSALKAHSKSDGWKALQKRCEAKEAELMQSFLNSTPAEMESIKKQIAVLRDVTNIENEMAELAAAEKEILELNEE